MPTIYLMIGVPASGKTTWAKEKLKELDNAIYVGSDSIRLELWGNEQDQQHNRETFQEVFNRIVKAAKEKKNIIYDATNISRKEKENILKLLTNDYTKIGVKMSTPIKDCYKRNLKRNRTVPEKVIGKMEVRMTYDMDLFDDYLKKKKKGEKLWYIRFTILKLICILELQIIIIEMLLKNAALKKVFFTGCMKWQRIH